MAKGLKLIAAMTAALLVSAPYQVAYAQWWQDDQAYEESNEWIGDDYVGGSDGMFGDDQTELGEPERYEDNAFGEQGPFGEQEPFGDEDYGAGGYGVGDGTYEGGYYDDSYYDRTVYNDGYYADDGYYDEDFDDDDWFDWF